MASIEQRLARLEARRPPASAEPDLAAEAEEYGAPLWTVDGRRAYGRMEDGMHWLTILDTDGSHMISYVSAFDPASRA